MCAFLSAIVTRTGQIYCEPEHTDSHSHLIEAFNLKEGANCENFVRVELTPKDIRSAADVSSYSLRVDETHRPSWFGPDEEASTIANLTARVERMIVRGDERKVLLGGCWILAGDARVDNAIHARIVWMLGSSHVGKMRESSHVGKMRESSHVGKMRESSHVGKMRESSQVRTFSGYWEGTAPERHTTNTHPTKQGKQQ